jgi:hypothetical protein
MTNKLEAPIILNSFGQFKDTVTRLFGPITPREEYIAMHAVYFGFASSIDLVEEIRRQFPDGDDDQHAEVYSEIIQSILHELEVVTEKTSEFFKQLSDPTSSVGQSFKVAILERLKSEGLWKEPEMQAEDK